jgi:hypothetical protein
MPPRTADHRREIPAGQKARPGRQYVYAVCGGGLVKIGISKDPMRMLGFLQLGSPVLLTLTTVAPGNWQTEESLHETLSDRRRHGEWFEVTEDEVLEAFGRLTPTPDVMPSPSEIERT